MNYGIYNPNYGFPDSLSFGMKRLFAARPHPVMDRIYPSIRKHRKPAIFDSLSHSGFFSSKTPKNHPIRQNYLR